MNRLSKRLDAQERKRGVKKPYPKVYSYIIHGGDPVPPEMALHELEVLVIVNVIVSPPKRDPMTGEILDLQA